MTFNVYIRYNDTNEVELWDTANSMEEVDEIIHELITEDEIAISNGIPVYNCTYFAEQA